MYAVFSFIHKHVKNVFTTYVFSSKNLLFYFIYFIFFPPLIYIIGHLLSLYLPLSLAKENTK